MKTRMLTCVAMLLAVPAAAQEVGLKIELLRGHPIYHEPAREAGVAMALTITPGESHGPNLMTLCEELQATAELGSERDGLRLETVFVVPYKRMAVEGYYWPRDGEADEGVLIAGDGVARKTLDDIVARAGIPPDVLDETNVEQEISCSLDEPLWSVDWYDVRLLGDEEPDAVIARARDRFLAIHTSVVEHNRQLQTAQEAGRG